MLRKIWLFKIIRYVRTSLSRLPANQINQLSTGDLPMVDRRGALYRVGS